MEGVSLFHAPFAGEGCLCRLCLLSTHSSELQRWAIFFNVLSRSRFQHICRRCIHANSLKFEGCLCFLSTHSSEHPSWAYFSNNILFLTISIHMKCICANSCASCDTIYYLLIHLNSRAEKYSSIHCFVLDNFHINIKVHTKYLNIMNHQMISKQINMSTV